MIKQALQKSKSKLRKRKLGIPDFGEKISSNDSSNISKLKKFSNLKKVSCIFKVFDDVRNDSLALQVIKLFQDIFDRTGLNLPVYPYKTISNRTGEVIFDLIDLFPLFAKGEFGKCFHSFFKEKSIGGIIQVV